MRHRPSPQANPRSVRSPSPHRIDAPSSHGPPAETVPGLRAGLAVFRARSDDLVAVAFTRAVRAELRELVAFCAARGLPCVEMSENELERWADSPHSEGLCVKARPRPWLPASDIATTLTRGIGVGIALDRVRNPYNVGAIVRSAAFFGLDVVLLGAPAPQPDLAVTAVRVAEGGVESLRISRTTDLADTLARLRTRGVRVFGAEGRAPVNAQGFAFARPAMLVMGNEREGLGPRVRAQCDALIAIRGRETMESLNVAVAAGVLFAEVVRGGCDKKPVHVKGSGHL